MVTVCPSQFATRRTLFHVLVVCGLLMLKVSRLKLPFIFFFFFNYTATTEIYTLSLHDALPITLLREAEAFDDAVEIIAGWPHDERRAGAKVLLQALAERRIGRRDQAQAWVWRLAAITRELHEEYAVQRWPETKRLLGLFVNSSGRAHGRNARRIVHAARQQDRRLAISLLAAAVAHTPEAEEVLRGARMRMARKPSAVARELLRNFPKAGSKRRRRRTKGGGNGRGPGREKLGEADARDAEKA